MTRVRFLSLAVAAIALFGSPALATDNFVAKDGNGNLFTKAAKDIGAGVKADEHVNVKSDGSELFTDAVPAVVRFTSPPTVSVGSLPSLPAGSNAIGSITNTSFGAKLLDNAGTAFGTSGNPVYVTGISGGSIPTGTAGSPNANAITVQGFASGGTPVPVSAASLPLPTGAANATNQTTANTTLNTIQTLFGSASDTACTSDTTCNTFMGAWKALVKGVLDTSASSVAVTSSALPTGAATEATQLKNTGYNAPYASTVALTVGTAVAGSSIGRAVSMICTATGNVSLTLSGGSTYVVPVSATGLTILPFAVTTVNSSGTTATCTYANLL